MAQSTITPLLVTGLLALLGTVAGTVAKGCMDDSLARHKLAADLVLKALESPADSTRLGTLYMLTQTRLIADDEINRGVLRYKHSVDSIKRANPRRTATPQVLPDAAGPPVPAELAAPLIPNARIYLLTGRAQDKADDGEKALGALRLPLLKAGFTIINGRYLEDRARPNTAEVRYFFPADQPQAAQLATFFRYWLKQDGLVAKRYTDRRVGPGYLEIWTGR